MKVSKLTRDCTSHLPRWKPSQEFDTSDVRNCRLRIENRLSEWAMLEDCGRSNKGVRFICNSCWVVRVLVGACWLGTLTPMNAGEHFCLLNCSSTMSLALHFFFYKAIAERLRKTGRLSKRVDWVTEIRIHGRARWGLEQQRATGQSGQSPESSIKFVFFLFEHFNSV